MAELVALRLSLPGRFTKEPLDSLLGSLTPATGMGSARPLSAQRLGRDLLRAERGVACLPWVSRTCLYRALARYAVLRKSGADATFVMGVGANADEPGHAWIEVGGRPFHEPGDVSIYTVTLRYPHATSTRNAGRLEAHHGPCEA